MTTMMRMCDRREGYRQRSSSGDDRQGSRAPAGLASADSVAARPLPHFPAAGEVALRRGPQGKGGPQGSGAAVFQPGLSGVL
jgi:hypothetical protein